MAVGYFDIVVYCRPTRARVNLRNSDNHSAGPRRILRERASIDKLGQRRERSQIRLTSTGIEKSGEPQSSQFVASLSYSFVGGDLVVERPEDRSDRLSRLLRRHDDRQSTYVS